MKKLIGILVVISFTLIINHGVAGAITITPYTYNSGATQWVNTTSAVGDWSLELSYPADGIHYAGVKVTDLGDPQVKDFAGWSYWTKGPEFHGVNFWMFLDTPHDNYVVGGVDYGYDIMLGIMPYNMMGDDTVPGDTWVNLQSSEAYPYQVWSPSGGYDISMWPDGTTWAEFQSLNATIWGNDYDFGEAIVRMVIMRTGGGGVIAPVTAYLDDFTLNGTSIQVEGGAFTVAPTVPLPGAVWLLGSGLLGLIGLKRRFGC